MPDDASNPVESGFFKDAVLLSSKLHQKVSQQLIVTNEDKLTICLTRYQQALAGARDWIGPLGIVVSILAALVVTEKFRPFFGFNPDQWRAMFVLGGLFSLGFFLFTVVQSLQKRKERSIEFVIKSIRKVSEI